jgi:hypothetical protein
MSDLQIVIGRDYTRELWMAAIMRGNEVMTVGYESTKEEAMEWARKAVKARAWEKGVDDPPDVYARAAWGEKE